MKYFIKRCGFQELGSVGADGKAKRGRYLMSSMNHEVVDFFPQLSKSIPNDTALLALVPLYSGIKTYCNYVYHNSKYTGTTAKHPRNEYRIYLNNELENHTLYYAAEDIVIFRKSEKSSFDGEGRAEQFYYVDVLKDHASGDYIKMNRLIEAYPINGGYGMYDGVLDFFEDRVALFEKGQKTTEVTVDKSVTDRILKTTDENKQNLFNSATFRDFVLAGYGNACAITGQIAQSVFGEGIDVVYIVPRDDGGDCMPSNGIALCKKLSVDFVQGKFTLSDNCEVMVHPESKDEALLQYNMKQIRVPQSAFFRPDINNIHYHQSHIYGSFLKYYGGERNECD